MKKLSAIAMALALLLMSSPPAYPQAKQTTTPPPVAPTLVREGDFATSLVSALDIGTAENETEAETMLASAGIAPKNGWISDYPVTPDIVGELQDAVAAAADSNRLPMGKDEALEVLDSVSADFGLYVLADTSGEYAEAPPPASPQYTEPTVINNYYYREGPPVVTYYPPPPDYLYLYAWVPYPFWCTSFFFSGFFILHDFHRVSIIHKRVVMVTNHVFHPHHRRYYKIDPVKRRGGRSLRGVAEKSYRKAHTRAEAQRGARSILQRSHERMASQRRLVNRNVAILKSPKVFKARTSTEIARQKRAFSGRTGARVQTSPRQNVKRALRDSARSFTALGRNERRPFRHPTARGRDSSKAAGQIRAFSGRTGARVQTSRRQNVKRALRDSARSFATAGRNERRPFRHPTARGRDSSKAAGQIRAFNGRSEVRAQNSPRQEVQRAPRDSARFLRAPGGNKGRSSSLPSMGERSFSGGLHKGSKGFSGKVSRKLPGGFARKGALKLPF